jgi:uncharacterized protein (DUF1810 family)
MLDRFLAAQEPVYACALEELRDGRKRGHWMWFVLPQIAGLGLSDMSRCYGIRDLEEARAYAAHPVLGARLRDCVAATLKHPESTAHQIFGTPDDMKFRSCLTLFLAADPEEALFRQALKTFYSGEADPGTLKLLGVDWLEGSGL